MLGFLATVGALACTLSVPLQDERVLKIGVVHGDNPAGRRMLRGIEEAIEALDEGGTIRAEISQRYPYTTEEAGLVALHAAIEAEDVHVVLGPSDTGVFLYLEKIEELDKRKVVVSPLVTTDFGNDADGWFFRTNVGVNTRAKALHDHLTKREFENIAVVYESTDFGEAAEKAFRARVSKNRDQQYIAIPYRNTDEIRDAADRIGDVRPGAVGIFSATREHAEVLQDELRAIPDGWCDYDPLLFAIVDARTVCMEGLTFASLGREGPVDCDRAPEEKQDELTDLGYDTALHVVNVAADVREDPGSTEWAPMFREQFAKSMRGPIEPLPRTGMWFAGMRNLARPAIFTVRNEAVVGVASEEPSRVASFIDVRRRRFAYAPIVNILLVVGIVATLSFLHVRKTLTGKARRFIYRKPFLKLAGFNTLVALIVLVALTESGSMRWDNVLGALGVAFGYTALLKSTLFETRAGQSIGLAAIYDSAVQHISKRLKTLRWELETPKLSYLSYTNTRAWLHRTLLSVHAEGETPAKAEELMKNVNEQVGKALQKGDEAAARCVYVRELLDLLEWEQLRRARLVPPDMEEKDVYDPALALMEAAEHCTNVEPAKKGEIEGLVEKLRSDLERENDDESKAKITVLESRRALASSERGRTYINLEWLVLQHAISLNELWYKGFVPADYLRNEREIAPGDRAPREVTGEGEVREARSSDMRLPVHGVLGLSVVTPSGETSDEREARWVNVSLGGACVRLDDELTLNGNDRVHLVVRDGPLDGLELDAAVRACERGPDGEGIRCHLQWLDLEERMTQQLEKFLVPA
jgi:hypothetical protein